MPRISVKHRFQNEITSTMEAVAWFMLLDSESEEDEEDYYDLLRTLAFAHDAISDMPEDETTTGSASEGDDEATSDDPEEGAKAPQALQPELKQGSKRPSSTSLESNDDNDGDGAQGTPTYRSKSKARGASTQRGRVRGKARRGCIPQNE